MIQVRATDIPPDSKIFIEKEHFDWFDAYQVELDDPDERLTSWTVCEIFLQTVPLWVKILFGIRNLAVKCIGLKTASLSLNDGEKYLRELKNRTPDGLPFDVGVVDGKIFSASDQEIVAGANDWHLDFKGSILVRRSDESNDGTEGLPKKSILTATTLVHFKHWFGRLYFLPVKPFHKLIVHCCLARLARRWNQTGCQSKSLGEQLQGR